MLDYENHETEKEEKRTARADIDSVRIVGPKPSWTNVLTTDPDFNYKYRHALNWAHYSLEDEELKEEVLTYLKNKNKNIDIIKEAKTWRFITLGKICAAINNGCPVNSETQQFLNSKLLELETGAKLDNKESVPVEKVKKLKKSELKAIVHIERLDNTIASIDNEIDKMILSNEEVDVYSLLLNLDIETSIAKEVREYYNQKLAIIIDEHRIIDKDDTLELDEIAQYKEDLNKHVLALRHILWQVDSYLGNNKAKRNTNKIKNKYIISKNEKTVKNVKFKTHDNNFKVQSIPLDRIIGTQMLLTFNVSNRKLSIYYAEDEKGLQVKGTTITNYDEKKSVQKTLRQPEKLLSHLQQSSDYRARVVFKTLSTKAVSPNGRLNQHTIILKAFKALTKV